MRNILGNNLTVTLFGESHGEQIGAVIDGLCAGIEINYEHINDVLKRRRPGKTDTARIELDNYKIVSGVYNGYTTGEPVCILIENKNTQSADYESIKNTPRPGHADYAVYMKNDGYNDYRGGGHTSGRITTPICLVGSILESQLNKKGIKIATHILEIGNVKDQKFSLNNLEEQIDIVNSRDIPLIDDLQEEVAKQILTAKNNQNSIGGVIETVISGLPCGIGDPWFSSFEGTIANAVFSIGGVKGIEFGEGFAFKDLLGKVANDEFYYDNGLVKTKTNHNGGVNGGITNGMPVVFRCAIKPTPSISQIQETINLQTKENTTIVVKGRHDSAIIRRICIVISMITSIVVADMLTMEYGRKYLK